MCQRNCSSVLFVLVQSTQQQTKKPTGTGEYPHPTRVTPATRSYEDFHIDELEEKVEEDVAENMIIISETTGGTRSPDVDWMEQTKRKNLYLFLSLSLLARANDKGEILKREGHTET